MTGISRNREPRAAQDVVPGFEAKREAGHDHGHFSIDHLSCDEMSEQYNYG
jgi:hypothetical protein